MRYRGTKQADKPIMSQMGTSVQVNIKVVVIVVVSMLFLVYLWYSLAPSDTHMPGLKRHKTWRTRDFVDIPDSVISAMNQVEIKSRRLEITVHDTSIKVHYLEAIPKKRNDIPVLFLHGMAFKAENWRELKSLHLMAAMGFYTVAVDLPGHGDTEHKSVDKVKFMKEFIKHAHVDRPVIISPSMSGSYSLPYLMEKPEQCQERASGFVPVAPVESDKWSDRQYHQCAIPVMITYGSKDKSLGLDSTGNLRNMANHEIYPVQNGKHAFYTNYTDEWHKLLYNFLLAVEREDDGS